MKTCINVKYVTAAMSSLSVRRNICLPYKRTLFSPITSWKTTVSHSRPLTAMTGIHRFIPLSTFHFSTSSSKESVPSKPAISVKDYFNILGIEVIGLSIFVDTPQNELLFGKCFHTLNIFIDESSTSYALLSELSQFHSESLRITIRTSCLNFIRMYNIPEYQKRYRH
jgi:hypothetical protein